MALIDILNQRFGRLTVVAFDGRSPTSRYVRWLCRCDCGQERKVSSQALREGRQWSCGCGRKEKTKISATTHGGHGTPEYAIWWGIICRCENKNVKAFSTYGGAGVKICRRWRNGDGELSGFECFLTDMGQRPSPKHSVDRYPDPFGNYEPGNCRWATILEQANNRRHTRHVFYRGEEMPLCDAVRLAGSVIHYEAAWSRIKTGWKVEKALETPRLFVSHASKRRCVKDAHPDVA